MGFRGCLSHDGQIRRVHTGCGLEASSRTIRRDPSLAKGLRPAGPARPEPFTRHVESRVAATTVARHFRRGHQSRQPHCGDTRRAAGRPTTLCWLIVDGRRVPLQPGENILGRDVHDGISIDSSSVSRRHARISVTPANATIDDLGSKNGTYVRGERIATQVPLHDGDEVRVGSVMLQFRQPPGRRSTLTLVVDRRV